MSARLHPQPEPGQSAPKPTARLASPLDPVQVDPMQDDPLTITDDYASTALAEPEVAPEPAAAAQAGSAMIVFEDVSKVYEPRVVALEGVSFTIEKGEFVFVVGASGSGKSTMIRLLLKELEPTAGRIIVGGRDLGRLKHSKVP